MDSNYGGPSADLICGKQTACAENKKKKKKNSNVVFDLSEYK